MLTRAKRCSPAIADFSQDSLDRFRELRNQITHRGFSSQDDSESVRLYLEVGLPFLQLCYREFHGFDLMDGLLQEYTEQINIAQTVLGVWKAIPDVDLSYCLHAFGHLIRWCFKRSLSSGWEIEALIHSEEVGGKFERTIAERERLEKMFRASWTFSCPLCDEYEGVIAELDVDAIHCQEVTIGAMACTNCGFVVHGPRSQLSQLLLERQVSESRKQILQEFGVGMS